MVERRLSQAKHSCPCCGFPTLHEPAAYEICRLCCWEDDGQSDADADDIRGGPNGDLSLSVARRNFVDHLTMYERGRDTRLGGEDTTLEIRAKQALIAAYTALRMRPRDVALSASIDEQARLLRSETDRKLLDGGHLTVSPPPDLPNER